MSNITFILTDPSTPSSFFLHRILTHLASALDGYELGSRRLDCVTSIKRIQFDIVDTCGLRPRALVRSFIPNSGGNLVRQARWPGRYASPARCDQYTPPVQHPGPAAYEGESVRVVESEHTRNGAKRRNKLASYVLYNSTFTVRVQQVPCKSFPLAPSASLIQVKPVIQGCGDFSTAERTKQKGKPNT
ncbi:hypothetical protein CBL_14492 [Carabus blaptoides fortunei]